MVQLSHKILFARKCIYFVNTKVIFKIDLFQEKGTISLEKQLRTTCLKSWQKEEYLAMKDLLGS